MPIQRTAATGSMLAATVIAATGLNLGVIGLNTKEPSPTAASAVAVPEQAPASAPTLPGTPTNVATTGSSLAPQTSEATANPAPTASQQPTTPPPAPQPVPPTTERTAGSTKPSSTTISADDDHDDGHEHSDGHEHDDRSTSTTTTGSSSSNTTPPTVEPSPPATTAPAPTTTQPSTTTTEPVTTAPPVLTEYLTYEFEGVATIIVALHDGQDLEFWSAVPDEDWVFKVEDNEPSKVKIKFRPADGGDEAEFEVKSEGGRIKVKREY